MLPKFTVEVLVKLTISLLQKFTVGSIVNLASGCEAFTVKLLSVSFTQPSFEAKVRRTGFIPILVKLCCGDFTMDVLGLEGVAFPWADLKLSQLNRGLPTFFKVFLAEKNLHKVGNPCDNFKCTEKGVFQMGGQTEAKVYETSKKNVVDQQNLLDADALGNNIGSLMTKEIKLATILCACLPFVALACTRGNQSPPINVTLQFQR